MRYQNWDVLIFPDLCKVPLQEFKTSCHVVQDRETHSFQTSPHLLPTVTCFIPGLLAGTPFRVSIHCWETPEISRYIQNVRKSTDLVIFEARLFVDGNIIGSKWFHQAGPWPTVLDLSIDLDKNGEFEKLKFPAFHQELLSQNYWNAGDDLGRLRLIVSEGIARDNMSYPFERIKNVASFSFQHAPLDVLEQSAIAWPNASMWRQVSLVAPYMAQHHSPRASEDAMEAHSHSPRRGSVVARVASSVRDGSIKPPTPLYPRQQPFDPFTDQVHAAFNKWRQPSADISMPDYASSRARTRASSSRQVTDPMSITGASEQRAEPLGMPDSQFDSLCEALMPSAPVNTPQNRESPPSILVVSHATLSRSEKASNNDQPSTQEGDAEHPDVTKTQKAVKISSIKSRKENVQASPLDLRPEPTSMADSSRKISQSVIMATNSGSKRQRITTPTSNKIIDDEDEPRSSPTTRKTSRASILPDVQGQRRVLSDVTNV